MTYQPAMSFLSILSGLLILISTLGNDPSDPHQACKTFLTQNMPERDLNTITPEYLNATIAYALKARQNTAWAQNVPWEIFLNDVLPYSSLSESRDNWRPLFYDTLMPLVKSTSNITAAFKIINAKIWPHWNVSFKSNQTPLIMSTFETMAYGHASCTGMSIFLVNALRSVGIPAHVTGVPEWNNAEGGNHDWVELWDGEHWSFTEFQNLNYNQTWFYPGKTNLQVPGSLNHSIYSASWTPTNDGRYFVMSWDYRVRDIPASDVTLQYKVPESNANLMSNSEIRTNDTMKISSTFAIANIVRAFNVNHQSLDNLTNHRS